MSRGDHGDTLDDEPMDETFSIKWAMLLFYFGRVISAGCVLQSILKPYPVYVLSQVQYSSYT